MRLHMPKLLTGLIAAVTPALLSAQTAPAPAPAAAPTTAPVAAAPALVDADPAIWVVKDKDTTIYLFGTIHVLKPGLSWFDEAVKTAFDKSDQIALEIPLPTPEEAQKVILPLALATDGKPLTGKIPADKRAAYAAVLGKLGLQPDALDKLQPWFAAVTMAQLAIAKAGYSPDAGAERALDSAAKAAGKPVIGLETLAQQLGYFAGLSDQAQIAFLVSGVDDFDKFDSTINNMVDTWKAGNPDALAKVMNDDVDKLPELYKVLLADRNARWATWIDERMKTPGTVFIAVGAGHLAGKDSVQVQLMKYHLKAKRIAY